VKVNHRLHRMHRWSSPNLCPSVQSVVYFSANVTRSELKKLTTDYTECTDGAVPDLCPSVQSVVYVSPNGTRSELKKLTTDYTRYTDGAVPDLCLSVQSVVYFGKPDATASHRRADPHRDHIARIRIDAEGLVFAVRRSPVEDGWRIAQGDRPDFLILIILLHHGRAREQDELGEMPRGAINRGLAVDNRVEHGARGE
jgi:hypothetical protein